MSGNWFGARRNDRPTILFYNDFFGRPPDTKSLAHLERCNFTTDRRTLPHAAAVIFHIPAMRRLPRIRKRPDQLWVAWSMESAANYPLLADPHFMAQFDLTMTYRRDADIWCPYLPDLATFERAVAKPVPAKTASAPVVMFQSAEANESGRNTLAVELMKHIGVHSYGRYLKNRVLDRPDLGNATKLEVISTYKFGIGFENSIAQDYVTEKFFDPLLAGTVPVYLGAPNVEEYAPGPHAFINASEFADPRGLAEFLTELAGNEDAYRKYFKWRETGLSSEFRAMMSEASREPFERLSDIVAARTKPTVRRFRWPWRR